MKTPIAVSLVVVGGLLIVAPIVSDYLQRAQVARALAQPGVQSISLEPNLSTDYRFGCWLVGTLAIASVIIRSWKSDRVSPQP